MDLWTYLDVKNYLIFYFHILQAHLEIPAFQKVNTLPKEEIPRWSIRRAVCPVCSQKWKDKSSVTNIKCSGKTILIRLQKNCDNILNN